MYVKHQISREKVFLNLFKFKVAVFISFWVGKLLRGDFWITLVNTEIWKNCVM